MGFSIARTLASQARRCRFFSPHPSFHLTLTMKKTDPPKNETSALSPQTQMAAVPSTALGIKAKHGAKWKKCMHLEKCAPSA